MSTFDPQAFENMVIEQSNETKSTPVPEGDYKTIIDSVNVKSVKIKSGDREGQEVPVLQVVYQILDEDGTLAKQLNMDKITVRQDVWLDVSESGTLAFGPNQNVRLGKLRDAVGLNQPNKPFSFKMLEGQGPLLIGVGLDIRDDLAYNRVNSVQKFTG